MRLPAITPRQIVMPLVVLLCGALVLYPIGFLINASLNVGDPSAFPPEEYGLDNFVNLTDDYRALANTLLVSCIATVLAVIFGFLQAWILTRTNIPGRQRLERLMELPYPTALPTTITVSPSRFGEILSRLINGKSVCASILIKAKSVLSSPLR